MYGGLAAIIGGLSFVSTCFAESMTLRCGARICYLRPMRLPYRSPGYRGRVPPRMAQIVSLRDVSFASVHLSHGQFLNRWQLLQIARALDGSAAIVGDFNAVGPTTLSGFKDFGPSAYHLASKIISPFGSIDAWRED